MILSCCVVHLTAGEINVKIFIRPQTKSPRVVMEEIGGMMHVSCVHTNAPRASVTRDQEIPARNSRDWRQLKQDLEGLE